MKHLAVLLAFLLSALVARAQELDSDTRRIDQVTQKTDPQWPSFGLDYTNQRHFPGKQINPQNVQKLGKAWEFRSGVKSSFQVTPIVSDGVMYISLPFNHVVALDAKTGKQLWRYQHQMRANWKMCCGPANRGVAVAYGKVFMGTVDARLLALDSKTGKVLWDINVVEDSGLTEGQDTLNKDDPNSNAKVSGGTGVGVAMAPIVYQNKVIVGITGVGYGLHIDNPREDAPLGAVIGVTGRYGRPGFLAAFDIQDGSRVWQFDTIPEQGWEGQFTPTTHDGIPLNRDIQHEKSTFQQYRESARYGGGSAWTTPAIDSKTGVLFFGTGNPSPQMNDVSRPGDNLYTVSLVALDVATGKLKWHYQQVPHDVWGYDLASPPFLVDLNLNGKIYPAVAEAGKTGWLYVHDRMSGKLLMKSEAFVPQKNMFSKATFDGVILYPGILGGVNWSPASVDPARQKAFVAAIHAPVKYTLHETVQANGLPPLRYTSSELADAPRWGLLSAIDLSNGKIAWQNKTDQPLLGGILSTASGLIFMGEGDGHFNAYDSSNGHILWRDKLEYGEDAPPISYQIDGKQYVAVAAGGNAILGYKQGDLIVVYELK